MKTPEELTAEWKLNKKRNGYFYYQDVNKDIYVSQWYKLNPAICVKVLAPVPTYDEYKAMQEELAEHRHYCCCMENEVMRLDKAKLEEENKQLRALLKECKEYLSDVDTYFNKNADEAALLLTKIDEVLK